MISAVKWVVIRIPPLGLPVSLYGPPLLVFDGYFTKGIAESLILWYTLLASHHFTLMYGGWAGQEGDVFFDVEGFSDPLMRLISDLTK